MAVEKTMDKIVALARNRGFIFQGSEIYGGLANSWDYGPLGVLLKNNVKAAWWQKFVQENPYNVGVDCAILMNPQVWVASGHVGGFSDPLIDCKQCKSRHRADKLIEDYNLANAIDVRVDGWNNDQLVEYIRSTGIPCPDCGGHEFTDVRKFNLMFKTFQGVTEDSKAEIYLRPETAQGIFVNFKNVQRTTRRKIPFGICQIGKAFRNEITPGNFIFRTREFEQMEMEFFVEPGTDAQWHQYWIDHRTDWYVDLGIARDNLRHYEHPKEKLSHYSTRTVDIEYRFGFTGSEWGELEGIANRTDFDLKTHSEHSGQDLSYFDQAKGERWVPYVIEPAAGLTRSLMAFLVEAYAEDEAPNAKGGVDTRTVLRLDRRLAPTKAAVLPLSRHEDLSPAARDLAAELRKAWNVDFDDAGAIGRRYRRQDEVGTPYCITVDFDTLTDQAVTIRERDSMTQERVAIAQVRSWLAERLIGC
jgi:glycyl-tRNA synthetase